MSYYVDYAGEIRISPPLNYAEIGRAPIPEISNFRLVRTSKAVDTPDGPLTRITSDEIISFGREDGWEDGVVAELQAVVDAFPEHEFSGTITCQGEWFGDIWTIEIDPQTRQVYDSVPTITWPDGSETDVRHAHNMQAAKRR